MSAQLPTQKLDNEFEGLEEWFFEACFMIVYDRLMIPIFCFYFIEDSERPLFLILFLWNFANKQRKGVDGL